MANVKNLMVRIGMDASGMTSGMKKSQATISKEMAKSQKILKANMAKISTGMSKIGNSIGRGFLVAGAAVTAAGVGMVLLGKKAIATAGEIQKMADVTGFTAEQIQVMKYQGTMLDVELETITASQRKLTKAMDSARLGTELQADAFKQLGVDAVDSTTGQLRDSKIVMYEVFEALGNVGNETERDAISLKLFGKSATELNPLIKAGSAELKRLADQAYATGSVMSNETIANLDALGDSMEAMKQSAGAAIANGLAPMIPTLMKLLPYIQIVIEAFGRLVGGFVSFVAQVFGISTAQNEAAKSAESAANAQSGLAENIDESAEAAEGALSSFEKLNVLQSAVGSNTLDKTNDLSNPNKDTVINADVQGLDGLQKFRDILESIGKRIDESGLKDKLIDMFKGLGEKLEGIDWNPILRAFGWIIDNAEKIVTALGTVWFAIKTIEIAMGIVGAINMFANLPATLTAAKLAITAFKASTLAPLLSQLTLVAAAAVITFEIKTIWDSVQEALAAVNAVSAAWDKEADQQEKAVAAYTAYAYAEKAAGRTPTKTPKDFGVMKQDAKQNSDVIAPTFKIFGYELINPFYVFATEGTDEWNVPKNANGAIVYPSRKNANGAIVTSSIMTSAGEAGEAGAEAIFPLENSRFTQAFAKQIATEIGGGGNTEVILKLNEIELGRAIITALNKNAKRTGKTVVMGV